MKRKIQDVERSGEPGSISSKWEREDGDRFGPLVFSWWWDRTQKHPPVGRRLMELAGAGRAQSCRTCSSLEKLDPDLREGSCKSMFLAKIGKCQLWSQRDGMKSSTTTTQPNYLTSSSFISSCLQNADYISYLLFAMRLVKSEQVTFLWS